MGQIFAKYFYKIYCQKIFAAIDLRICSTVPLTFTSFSKPAGIPTDSCENSTAAEMGFNLYPNIKQK